MDLAYLKGLGVPSGGAAVVLKSQEDDPAFINARAASSTSGAAASSKGGGVAPATAANAIGEDPNMPHTGLYPGMRPGSSKEYGFLQEWIDIDLADGGRCAKRKGMKGDVIRTRFPPEPNGYLHIGHAKSIVVNFGLAKLFGGRCHLRFDDTNPAAEETEFVESIQEDVKWLGFDWGEHCYFASGYFDTLYEWAEHLIKNGNAFVDSETGAEIAEKRRAGTESRFRNRSPEENLKLFREMRDGKYKEGEHVLRMKGDMKNPNMNMRDMLIYRIMHREHHRTGNKWCIYPLYDFAHGEEDAIEGITHSICTLEFEGHRELYNWFTGHLPIPGERPLQLEMSRLNVTTFLTSKRKLKKLVEAKVVDGWDDPRMSTLSGLRRRGVRPECLRRFVLKAGVTRALNTSDVAMLENEIKEDLDPIVPRRMVVLDPLKVVIESYPEGKVEEFEALNHPLKPEMGSRKLAFSRTVYIEKDDFREDAPDNYFRLKPNGQVKLRYAYVLKCKEVIKNKAGEITELRCTHDPETRETVPKDVKGVIHWVSADHTADATVMLYDYLIKPDSAAAAAVEEEAQEEGEEEAAGADDAKMQAFLKSVNPNSLIKATEAKLEKSLADAKPMDRFQFERNGYFVCDKYSKATPIFNRTLALAVSGLAKDEDTNKAARSRKDQQDKAKAEKEAAKKVNPKDMFKSRTEPDENGKEVPMYKTFDADGIPTHDRNGEALPKARIKKLKAEWDKQKKLFES